MTAEVAPIPAGRALLFTPFKLRGVTFPNRVVIAPMQMYVAAQDGLANDWHFQHLAKYAVGGRVTGAVGDPPPVTSGSDRNHDQNRDDALPHSRLAPVLAGTGDNRRYRLLVVKMVRSTGVPGGMRVAEWMATVTFTARVI